MQRLDISAIILTFNEERHIRRCLRNISDFAETIYVVDSFSTDRTLEIARQFDNVVILQNKWVNYATQFNWALQNAPVKTKWVLRLDADEYLTPELKLEIEERLPTLPEKYSGVVFKRRRVFLGRTIRRGMPQVKLLRLFRYGMGICEVRMMDEHIQLTEGEAIEFKHEFADDNLYNLSLWAQKHIGYAIREAVDMLDIELNLTGAAETDEDKRISAQASRKRMRKHQYVKQPLFWRAFGYFLYRYFIRLGFTEGKEGFLWHFLQGWWYRTLVDAKIYEIKKACGKDKEKICRYLEEEYHISVEKINTG
ncbi:MAG: glycosyltransferase family 2 protein, partial [Prevotellaceae bacterium]|nr:glycosyltransferase family 2 protein [Prevotellaceae bacterium]